MVNVVLWRVVRRGDRDDDDWGTTFKLKHSHTWQQQQQILYRGEEEEYSDDNNNYHNTSAKSTRRGRRESKEEVCFENTFRLKLR